eukprot:CAMPEP_0179002696 /NCGR_PEP_ID=MMETSP0795-20121207/12205_1 /TAXON_ID=88552 /ORGANISM="Amoebophrya sp., Strain Ameob2" /LENGTH=303 /DNA_ID=CAMNT_0020696501 /DNA_START=371 /DNA_END=1282 /DNA_ORIENTATION=-
MPSLNLRAVFEDLEGQAAVWQATRFPSASSTTRCSAGQTYQYHPLTHRGLPLPAVRDVQPDLRHGPRNRLSSTGFVHSDESPSDAYTWAAYNRQSMTLPPPIVTSDPHADPAAVEHMQALAAAEAAAKANGGPAPRVDGNSFTAEESLLYSEQQASLLNNLPVSPGTAPANARSPPPAPPVEDDIDGQYVLPESYSLQPSTMLMTPERDNAGTKYALAMQENLFQVIVYGTSVLVLSFAIGVHNVLWNLKKKNIDEAMVEELDASLFRSESEPSQDIAEEKSDDDDKIEDAVEVESVSDEDEV